MKIYIFEQDCRCDYDGDNDIKPFANKVEAEQYFQEKVAPYKKDAKADGWVINEDSSVCFDAYEEGYECQNHCYFAILEFDI